MQDRQERRLPLERALAHELLEVERRHVDALEAEVDAREDVARVVADDAPSRSRRLRRRSGSASKSFARSSQRGNIERMPWWCAWRPVRIVTHDGNVRGSETYALSKRVPRAASAERCGATLVVRRSARNESAARMITLGRAGCSRARASRGEDRGEERERRRSRRRAPVTARRPTSARDAARPRAPRGGRSREVRSEHDERRAPACRAPRARRSRALGPCAAAPPRAYHASA